ncbi:MAG: FadR/GntR family transcriptional regulator [Tistlia sp.]|uniref:FadR/GntR family transcriptional regulator n=1 Tax=Tistlia sp. TaxID=3057121 RepID=UPI0034A37A7C
MPVRFEHQVNPSARAVAGDLAIDGSRQPPSVQSKGSGTSRLARPPSLPDEIARRLRDEIQRDALKPGDRLPSEQQLSHRFGVSRPVVREAISRLRYDGVVESFQGRGVFVKGSGKGTSFRIDDPDIGDQQELGHILELLVTVEVAATALAAERRSNEQLQGIKRALDAMATAIDQGLGGVDEDLDFHRRIVEAGGNPFFTTFIGFLESRVRNLIRVARTHTARFEGLPYAVQQEHEAIYRALAERDAAAAREAAERHLWNVASRLQLYRKDGAD